MASNFRIKIFPWILKSDCLANLFVHLQLNVPIRTSMAHQPSNFQSNAWLFLKYWGPVFFYCSIIVFLSSQSYPSQHLPSFLYSMSDKLLHGLEYGVLGILLYRAFHRTNRPLRSISLAIICAVGFGMSDEIHQWFVPNRQIDIWDLLADTLGASIFIGLWVFLTKKIRMYIKEQKPKSLDKIRSL